MNAMKCGQVLGVSHPVYMWELGEGVSLPGLEFRERFDEKAVGLRKAVRGEGAECFEDVPEECAVIGPLLDECE